MPEQLENVDAPPQEFPSFASVLGAYPDMPEGLARHVRRLSEQRDPPGSTVGGVTAEDSPKNSTLPQTQPTASEQTPDLSSSEESDSVFNNIRSVIEDARARVDYLEQHQYRSNKRLNSYSYKTMNKLLSAGEYGQEDLVEYIHALNDLCSANLTANTLRGEHDPQGSMYENLLDNLARAPGSMLKEIYFSKDKHQDLSEIIGQVHRGWGTERAINFLLKVYDCGGDMLALYEKGKFGKYDPALHEILGRPETAAIVINQLYDKTPMWPKDMEPHTVDIRKRDWGSRYLKLTTGLSDRVVDDLMFASYSRVTDKDTRLLDADRLAMMLERTQDSVATLGRKSIETLHHEAGITNIDHFSREQLLQMWRLVTGDKETIDHLKRGDVTVAFMDGWGDYNGAVGHLPHLFQSKSNRTLFFEIERPRDIYKYMLLLRKYGIKPSTMVIGAHGKPGSMLFGGGDDKFIVEHSDLPTEFAREPWNEKHRRLRLNIRRAKGFRRLVTDFMQDSRGIDDAEEAKGRRRLFLYSCSQAAPADFAHYTDKRAGGVLKSRLEPQPELVIGRESAAATFTKTAGSKKLDVYAGSKPLYGELTDNGIAFWTPVEQEGRPGMDKRLKATRYRLSRRGQVIETALDEVPLYRRPRDRAA